MIVSSKTIDVLRNFAEINQSLLFKQGKILKTISEQTNVMAKTTVDEEFPMDFAIYDLNKFLGVLSLFADPQLTFHDDGTSVSIQAGRDANNFVAGDQVAEYQFASKSLFEDEEKILAKEVELPTVDAEFELEAKYLQSILRAASIMSLPEIAVQGNNGMMQMKAVDSKAGIDSFSVNIGNTEKDFNLLFKIENFKMMLGSYDVAISEQGIGYFKNKDIALEYWIALEK
jgi:hypothetical protein